MRYAFMRERGSKSDRRTRRGGSGTTYALLASGMIVFGSATPVSKLVTDAFPVMVGSSLRVLLGALVLAPLAWASREAMARLTWRDWRLISLIALFGMFGFTVFMLFGMRMISGVAGSIVMATTPAVTAAAAVLLVGEQFNWRKAAAIALAVAGVAVLHATGGATGSRSQTPNWLGSALTASLVGSAMVFAAVCCEAAYTLIGRRVSQASDPRLVAFLGAALSLPVFLPFALWQWQDFDASMVGWQSWLALVWYGAGTLALGTALWYAGITRTEGSIAAAFMGLMPVSALVLSYVLLGEAFSPFHLLGFGCVFAGVLLISREYARTAK